MPFLSKEKQQEYLAFLRSLLKDQAYVKHAYMTGILPIASLTMFGIQESNDSFVDASGESLRAVFPADVSYSSGSELNMFVEYDMTVMERFSDYFGFTEEEVDCLFDHYLKITREELQIWYDGYHTAVGEKLYNPRSVVCALANNQLANYWTGSGPYDEIFFYVKNNVNDIREALVLMVSMELNTKNEIYSAMVIYGLLTYRDGKVFILNKELMDKFRELFMKKESMWYVYRLANESKKMLSATLRQDTDTMAEILEFAHNTESPILSHNNEIELSAVVNLVYLATRDKYRVEREDKAGVGYVDFIFYPERKTGDAMILELKVDSTPEDAIRQIKDKNYALRFKGKQGEKPLYGGILAVGIGYSKKTKKHSCKVEVL